jgi:hypothetical protein
MENLVNNLPCGKTKEVSICISPVPVGFVFGNKIKRRLRRMKERVESSLRSFGKGVFMYFFNSYS